MICFGLLTMEKTQWKWAWCCRWRF